MTTNGITDEEARFLVGDGADTPPGRTPLPTSEGTLSKGQYRRSDIHDLLSAIAVVNDDGTPILAGLETLLSSLAEIVGRLETSINAVAASTNLLTSVSEGLTQVVVKPQPFDTGWIGIAGIAPSSAYTTGDVVGDPIVFAGLPGSGVIETVMVLDEDKEEIASNLAIFSEAPTDVDDHDIFVIGVGEHHKQEGDIAVTNADYSTYSGSSLATVRNVGQHFDAPEGRLTVYFVTRGVPNIAAGKVLLVRFLGHSTFEDA